MADNVVSQSVTTAGTTFASDDIGGIHFPRSKITIGADGTNDGDVSSSNPMPAMLRSELVDDAAFTPATSRVVMVAAEFDDTLPDSVDEGDGGALRMSAKRSLYVNIRDNAGNERGLNVDASGNITVNVTGTVTVGSHAVTNAGVFAVQVDGSALTALQLIDDVVYADNAAFTDDVSKFALIGGVYQATPQTITDGRVAPILLDANGRIVVAAHAVTQSGTWNIATVTTVTTVSTVTNVATIGTSITPGTSAAHLGKAEDAAHASGDTGVAVLGVRRDTPVVGSDTDGDYSTFNFDSAGRLWCNVNNTVTIDSELPAAAVLADNTANPTVPGVAAFAMQWDGSTWDRWNGEVRIIQGQAGITAGSGAASATATPRIVLATDDPAVTSLAILDDWDDGSDACKSVGNVAHDAVDAGSPQKIGAQARSSEQTAVASADRVNLVADLVGKLITLPYANPENFLDGTVTLTTTANSSAFAPQGAGVRSFITSLAISNSSTTFTEVNIKDGTTIRAVYPAPGNGGAVHNLLVPLKGTANTDVNVNATTAVTSVKVTLFGYKGV